MAILLFKKFKKSLGTIFLPPLIYCIARFLYLTCTKKYHYDSQKVLSKESIFVLWHGELLMLIFAYMDYRKSKNIDTIVSEHKDGEIISKVLSLFGGGSIRGSSTRGGLRALRGALESLRGGRDVGITPDGPRGPRHSVANGVVLLAQKTHVPIVAMNVQASRAWRMQSWDKFVIPKPFSRLDFYYSDPFYVTNDSVQEAKLKIQERLMRHAI